MKLFSFRLKLIISFIFVALLISAAGFYTIFSLNTAKTHLFTIVENDSKRLQILQEIRFLTVDLQRDTLSYVAGHSPEHEALPFPVYIQKTKTTIETQLALYTQSSPENQKDRVDSLATAIRSLLEHTTTDSAKDLLPQNLEKFESDYTQASSVIGSLLLSEQQSFSNDVTEANRAADDSVLFTVLFTIAASLIAISIGFVIASNIGKYIKRLQEGADSITSGNFSKTVPVTTQDELGNLAAAFNKMARSLQESYHRIALEKKRDETLIESMGEGVVGMDTAGSIILINTAAVRLLNLETNQKAIGQNFTKVVELFGKESKPLEARLFPSSVSLESGKPVTDIYTIHDKDLRKRILEVSANPVSLEEKTAGVIVVVRDVTKEKEIDRMKTEFISLASHQLRTPLSAIKWYTEMLLSGDAGKLKNDQKEFAENIESSTERMIELVTSLLNISRIESGRIMVTPEPTDIRQLVSGIVNDLKAKTEEKKQTLVISIHSDLPNVMLDPRLIGQVFMNLLTNAIKYTPKEGEITVFVSKKGKEIIAQITDNGYGIPKSQQDRVFEKFFRAENIVKHETDGTGLGLYLIKAIIESSNGKIWFESEEGKGTTFWFSLPLSGMKARKGEVTLDE